MSNILVRDLSAEEHAALKALARQRGVTLNDVALEAVREFLQTNDPQLCLGYVEVAQRGDLTADDECTECGQELGWPYYVGLMADGGVHGPVCDVCAGGELCRIVQ